MQMTMISRLASLTLSALLTAGFAAVAQADDPNWDPVTQYIQRSDKINLGGGNAKDANAAIHVINPWPRGSSNRQIPANGERMSGAYERYRDVSKQPPRPIISPPTLSAAGGAGGAGGGAAATPAK
jgi:hypothetical protein